MTLGDFRRATAKMPDSVPLMTSEVRAYGPGWMAAGVYDWSPSELDQDGPAGERSLIVGRDLHVPRVAHARARPVMRRKTLAPIMAACCG